MPFRRESSGGLSRPPQLKGRTFYGQPTLRNFHGYFGLLRHMISLQIRAFAQSCLLLSVLCAAPLGAQGYRPVLTPALGDPRADVEIERHANGQLSKRVFRLDGKPHGLWQEWDVEGRVRLTAEWLEGKGEGVWMYFHPNGLVSERSWVTADLWHGPSEGWHANGQKSFEGTFVRGAKDGPFRYWAEDGTPSGPAAQLLTDTLGPVSAITDGWPAGMNVWDLSFSRDLETLFIGTGDKEYGERAAERRLLLMVAGKVGFGGASVMA